MGYSSRNRAFPSFLVSLLLLLVSGGIVYLLAVLPGEEGFLAWFTAFGEFICKYDVILIGILVVVNVVELGDMIIFAKRDEYIDRHFEYIHSKNLSMLLFFKHYFSSLTCRGPLIFAVEEQGSAIPRIIITLVSSVVKFVFWIISLSATVGMILYPAVYDFSLAEGADYSFTTMVLLLFLNCAVFVYALYRILPLHEVREYTTITYYTDGSSTKSRGSSSNIIAILILSGILYLFYTGYYGIQLSHKICRTIETFRFGNYIDGSYSDISIMDYYDQ